jgi:hypothetical protein
MLQFHTHMDEENLHKIYVRNFVGGGGDVARHFVRDVHNQGRHAPASALYQVCNKKRSARVQYYAAFRQGRSQLAWTCPCLGSLSGLQQKEVR